MSSAPRRATLLGSRSAPVVVKFGGELLEDAATLRTVAAAVGSATVPVAIVHGGGREIDAALSAAGIEKRQVDGLRMTDARTLDVVVAVLAGNVNSRFVAALGVAGVPAVGLTGIDGGCGLAERVPAHRTVDGRLVDLGYVGVPSDRAQVGLLETLIGSGFVPAIACIGVDERGGLLNVNADTFAGHLAAKLGARRLVIAGATAGVLGPDGATVSILEASAIPEVITSGTATAGMIAKLRACEHALSNGVEDVVIVDGRDGPAIEAAIAGAVPTVATRIVAGANEAV